MTVKQGRMGFLGSRRVRPMGVLLLFCCLATLHGCEADSYLNPSTLGRWERTPVVLPILDQLDVIDEPDASLIGLSQVRPEDLIPIVHEYVIGPGDLVTVTVFELITPNSESVQTRRVDALGILRLPVIGPVKAEGKTPSQLEATIRRILDDEGILRDAMVSVIMQDARQNTYSVIGEPRLSGTAIGTYAIPRAEFRLMDAMALARGVSGGIKKLYIIRQIELGGEQQAEVIHTPEQQPDDGFTGQADPVDDPTRLIEDLLQGPEEAPPTADENDAPDPTPAPTALERGIDPGQDGGAQWINLDGRWVRVDANGDHPAAGADPSALVTQRIIEIPYDQLLDGDMRNNVVIRPGDVIRVPPPVIGNVYIGGAISRPGTYALPGDRDLTLKQLIFAAGNVSTLAMPERVDLIRRVGQNQEAIVRLNLRSIFDGTQPDFYLKPNDTINIGTSFMATPLAVMRNGFRMSYGFGFILDRNFGPDLYGPVPDDN